VHVVVLARDLADDGDVLHGARALLALHIGGGLLRRWPLELDAHVAGEDRGGRRAANVPIRALRDTRGG